jgi:hypothetical protein
VNDVYRRLLQLLTNSSGASPELRRATRVSEPGVVVYYWDGSIPAGHGLRDVSLTGAYLYTPERWYPGTIVRLLLQDKRTAASGTASGPHASVSILARVVWHGLDGVALEFVFRTPEDRNLLRDLIAKVPNCGQVEMTEGGRRQSK